jgi:hypothetical protein
MKAAIAVAAVLLACPFGSRAGLVAATSDNATNTVLDVEYWGSVYTGSFTLTGEKVHGTMRVDTALAPPDNSPASWLGRYSWTDCGQETCPVVDAPTAFVSDDRDPVRTGKTSSLSGDHVLVIDQDPSPFGGNWDRFEVANHEGAGLSESWSLYLNVGSSLDFIQGTGLMQQFDLHLANSGDDSAVGYTAHTVNGVFSYVGFLINRIKATPKVCRF